MDGRTPQRVYASAAQCPGQAVRPPLLGQAMIEYDGAQASLAFDACVRLGCWIAPTSRAAAARCQHGPDPKHQTVTLYTPEGHATPKLEGQWFPDGFHGTMGELLSAIEENREPINSARNNLKSLALCFAAVASAERHEPVVPGTVRTLPK